MKVKELIDKLHEKIWFKVEICKFADYEQEPCHTGFEYDSINKSWRMFNAFYEDEFEAWLETSMFMAIGWSDKNILELLDSEVYKIFCVGDDWVCCLRVIYCF